MPDTQRTRSELVASFPANDAGLITDQTMRDFVTSVYVKEDFTSAPTPSQAVVRDSIGGVQFTVVNADTVDAPTINGDAVSGDDITATNTISINSGSASVALTSGAQSIRVADPDTGTAYFSVSSAGAIVGSSATIGGTNIITALATKANTSHTHAATDVTTGTLADARLSTNIPKLNSTTNTFTGTITAGTFSGSGASLTSIPQSAVTSLTTSLAGKASTTHTHAQTDVVGLSTTLAGLVPNTISISTTAPLTGGGDLSASRTLGISAATSSAAGSMSSAHFSLVNGATANATLNTLMRRNSSGGVAVNSITAPQIDSQGDMYITFNTGAVGGYFTYSDAEYGDAITIAGHVASISAKFIAYNGLCIATNGGTVPATATAAGTAGEIKWDANYLYVCVATNTWKRAALSTW